MRPIEVRLVGRFRFVSKIPGRHQHLLYKGVHTQTSESLFMKGEQYKLRGNDQFLTILQQGKILQIMQGGIGIPHMHWCGQQEDYNFIVLEQLDRSIQTLQLTCGGVFSQKAVLMLGQQLISILQYFHFKNFMHNQIKPSNIMLGPGEKQGKVFLVDYSAAARFKDAQTLQHIPQNNRYELRCLNMQFSSVRYNRGDAVSRRDDMQSLIYLMLYMMKGSLPWTEISSQTKKGQIQRARSVLKMKQEISQQQLFKGYPELLILFKYTKNLAFDQKPRYVYYKTVMKQKIEQLGFLDDKIYDWMLIEQPPIVEDPQLNFQVIPNQADFIRQISEELKLREKYLAQKEKQKQKKLSSTAELKSPRGKEKQKQCAIY